MNAIWERHKKFLLQVAGGLAVFLILLSLAFGYQDRAAGRSDIAVTTYQRQMERVKELDIKYARETQAKQDLERRADELLGFVSIERLTRRKPLDPDNPSTDFLQALQQAWTAFTDRADRQNLGHPVQNDVEFSLGQNLTEREWQDRYFQLEVLERFLEAAVDRQVRRLDAARASPVTFQPIPDNPGVVLVRYPVRVEVVATYATLLHIFQRFQKDGNCIGIELEELEPAADAEPGMLHASLVLVGMNIEAPREEPGGTSGGFRRGLRRR